MKKIAVGTAKAILKNTAKNDIIVKLKVDDTAIDVNIKSRLSLEDESLFVSRVVSTCFDSRGNYRPEYFAPMVKATFIQLCTNLPALSLHGETTESGGAAMDIDAMVGLYDSIYGVVEHSSTQHELDEIYGYIYQICDKAVKWRQQIILPQRRDEELTATFALIRNVADSLLDKINNTDMDSLIKYAGELSAATSKLEDGGIVKAMVEAYKNEQEG